MSDDEDDSSSISVVSWTVGLLDLPPEVQMEIFLTLFNQQSVVALRLTCHELEGVYQRIASTVETNQRERIIAPVWEYYEFLGRLWLPRNVILYPPPGGWPSIAPGPDNGFECKTNFAVDILRHLPYITETRGLFNHDTIVAYRSTVEDHSQSEEYDQEMDESVLEVVYETMLDEASEENPPSPLRHMLKLAYGWPGGGRYIFIDTWTGFIWEEEDEGEECAPRILARDYFEDKIKMLRRFDEVFVPGEDVILRRKERFDRLDLWEEGSWRSDCQKRYREYIPDDDPYGAEEMERKGEPTQSRDFGDEEDGDWVRHLYFKHGWPGEKWDKEACQDEIREFVHRRKVLAGQL
ncbi:hypothetical protein ACHAQA_007553 [Verticillium albo-atrum]